MRKSKPKVVMIVPAGKQGGNFLKSLKRTVRKGRKGITKAVNQIDRYAPPNPISGEVVYAVNTANRGLRSVGLGKKKRGRGRPKKK